MREEVIEATFSRITMPAQDSADDPIEGLKCFTVWRVSAPLLLSMKPLDEAWRESRCEPLDLLMSTMSVKVETCCLCWVPGGAVTPAVVAGCL